MAQKGLEIIEQFIESLAAGQHIVSPKKIGSRKAAKPRWTLAVAVYWVVAPTRRVFGLKLKRATSFT